MKASSTMSRIFGIHPALEALKAAPETVEKVYLAMGTIKGPIVKIAQEAQRLGIPVENIPRDRLAAMAQGGVHQGVVLHVAEFAYLHLEELLSLPQCSSSDTLLVVLDGIEDPHNLGALIRSAYAMGAQGMILPKDRAVGVTATAVKVSAGASAHLPIARVTNLSRAIGQIKQAGMWVVASDVHGDRCPESVDFRGATALVVGSESRGIRRIVMEKCDYRVKIPMIGSFGSLNASVSGGILLYEVFRQRRQSMSVKPK
jgi:23S rRNA (guanosine2251-2'-O)-methyltransferase